MFIYCSCIGNLYVSDRPLSDDELYCDICWDYHDDIGFATTYEKAWALLEAAGYEYEAVKDFLEEHWEG